MRFLKFLLFIIYRWFKNNLANWDVPFPVSINVISFSLYIYISYFFNDKRIAALLFVIVTLLYLFGIFYIKEKHIENIEFEYENISYLYKIIINTIVVFYFLFFFYIIFTYIFP